MVKNETLFDVTTMVSNVAIHEIVLKHYTKSAFINKALAAYITERTPQIDDGRLIPSMFGTPIAYRVTQRLMRRVEVVLGSPVESYVFAAVSSLIDGFNRVMIDPTLYMFGGYKDSSLARVVGVPSPLPSSLYEQPCAVREIKVCGKVRHILIFTNNKNEYNTVIIGS